MSSKVRTWLRLAPFLVLVGGLFLLAAGKMLSLSLNHFPLLGRSGYDLSAYRTILRDPAFWRSARFTISQAWLSSTLVMACGLLFAAHAAHRQNNTWLRKAVALPINLPYLIVSVMILQFFNQGGWLARVANFLLGLPPQAFPLLVHDRFGWGIGFVYLWKQIPYILFVMLTIFARFDRRLLLVGKTLGGNPRQNFWRITFPMIQAAFFRNWLIILTFSLGNYEVPFLLGNQRNRTLSVYLSQLYQEADLSTRPTALAAAVLFILLIVLNIAVLRLIQVICGKRRGKHGTR